MLLIYLILHTIHQCFYNFPPDIEYFLSTPPYLQTPTNIGFDLLTLSDSQLSGKILFEHHLLLILLTINLHQTFMPC